jgi:histidyl-tRNA synthetase
MRDLLPEEMARFRAVEAAFRKVSAAWGYREVRTPTLEHLYLFTSSGTLSPQLLGRVYSFLDWDGWTGERVVLRPDATIPVARLFRERLGGSVAKLSYVENIFRFSRDEQPREVWQCGAELIGDTWPAGDVELVLLALDSLRALGLDGVELTLSHSGIVRALLEQAGYEPEERSELYDRLLDGDLAVIRDLEARLPDLGPGLRLLTEVDRAGVAFVGNLRAAFAAGAPRMRGALDELELIGQALELAGAPPRISVGAVRDFEYYTGPVFHLSVGGVEVASGGRYDGLIVDPAGARLPACGFALQVDRLLALLVEWHEPTSAPIRIVAAQGPKALAAAAAVARSLHERGYTVGLAAEPSRGVALAVGADGALAVVNAAGTQAPVVALDDALRLMAGR